MWFSWWTLVWAMVGAFGTAALHQHTGRDPRTGGLIGLGIGGVLGPIFLVLLWAWLYYNRLDAPATGSQRPWYEWWRF